MSDKITRASLEKLWVLVELGGGKIPISMNSISSRILSSISEHTLAGKEPEIILLSIRGMNQLMREQNVGQFKGGSHNLTIYNVQARLEPNLNDLDFLVLP